MKLGEEITKELIDTSIDLGVDYSEIALDAFLDGGILEEIPIAKTLLSGTRIVLAVKERFFIKKFLTFLKEFHNGRLSEEALEEFKIKMNSDKGYNSKIVDFLSVMIERHAETIQSRILANLLLAHLKGAYDWERFTTLAICLDKLHPEAHKALCNLAQTNSFSSQDSNFEKNGITHADEGLLFAAGIVYRNGSHLLVSELGKDLYEYGIKSIM